MFELYFHWDLTMVFHQSSSRSMQITLLLKMFVLVITWFRVLTMGHHNFLSPFGKGGLSLFYYFKFNHIYCVWGGSKVPFITFRIFSLFSKPCKILIQVFIVLKPDIICTFLIHSGSLQKMLTALFNLICNTQKIKWTIFLVQRQDVS